MCDSAWKIVIRGKGYPKWKDTNPMTLQFTKLLEKLSRCYHGDLNQLINEL